MKRLIGFLMMALLAVTLIVPASPASAAEDALDKIIRTKTFNIGAIPGQSTKLDPNTGEWSGFIPDSLKWVCSQIKVKCKFHKTHWSTFAAGLQARTFELSAASTFTTPQRASAVAFLPTLYYLGNGVTTLKKNEGRFKTLDDINKPGVTISTGQGTSQHAWALEVFPKATLITSKALTETRLLDLLAGKADVALSDSGQSHRFAAAHPNVVNIFTKKPPGMTPIAWATRFEDIKLNSFMTQIVKVLISSGRFERLMVQYKIPAASYMMPSPALTPNR